MEIDAERASMAQEEGGHCSFKVPPFTPTHPLRDAFTSFTEFFLRNVEEWSQPHLPWPPPPPPVHFSDSDRFIKGRLPHRTVAISASLSSLFDDAAMPLLDVRNHGNMHADHDYTRAKMQDMTHDVILSKMHDRAPAASTHCNTSTRVVSSDNALKFDADRTCSQAGNSVQGLSSNGVVDVSACSTDNALNSDADCMRSQAGNSVQGLSSNGVVNVSACSTDNALKSDADCTRSQAGNFFQGLSSNGVVNVSACSTDNAVAVYAARMFSQDGSSVFSNEMVPLAACNTDDLRRTDSLCPHGCGDITASLSHEDDGKVQTLHKVGLPSLPPDGSLSASKKFDGSMHVPDIASPVDKHCLHNQYEEGCVHLSKDSLETVVGVCDVATERPVDVVVGHTLLSVCKSPVPSSGDADTVGKLSLPSPSKSLNDNNFEGDARGVPELSLRLRTKIQIDNIFTGDEDVSVKFSLLSPMKSDNDNNSKNDMDSVMELPLLSTTKRHTENNLICNAGVVTELSVRSPMKICPLNNVTCDADGLAQLSSLSPRKSDNANNLTLDSDKIAEIQLPPLTQSHNVNSLQNTVLETPSNAQQDEHVEDLEDGALTERLPDDECLETSEDGNAIRASTSHLFNATQLELKTLETTTDDEMNEPISLFISHYRTRSSVNPSSLKQPPLDINSKMKRKTGKKRKIEEQEQVLKGETGADMVVRGKSRHAKGVEKGASKVARGCANVLNDYNGRGLFEADISEPKKDVEKKYAELRVTQTGRDQVMRAPAVKLSERDDGAVVTHGQQLTRDGLARSEPFVTLEADVATKKPKHRTTVKKKKKSQKIKHRKTFEKRVLGKHKLRLKPCVDKPKEKKACHHYVRGKCDKGASCTFSHAITPTTKSEACKYLMNNCCLKGDDCPYSHALSTFPCKYFHTRGRCMEADSCRFSHEPISDEVKQKLLAKLEQERQVREGKKETDVGVLGPKNPKQPLSLSGLELVPLGGKRATKTPLEGKDSATTKTPSFSATITRSTRNSISASATKKAASPFAGGHTGAKATNLNVNRSLFCDGSLNPRGPSTGKSIEESITPTTRSTRRESEGLPAQARDSSNSSMVQERKTKVDAFLQSQLHNTHLLHKSKLSTSLKTLGGCYTLLNQPRAMLVGQTSLVKAPNTFQLRDTNPKAMGSLQASADPSQLIPTLKPSTCTDTMLNSGFSNGKLIGSNTCASHPSVLGPSLLDIVSMSQRATVPKEPACMAGVISRTSNAAPHRSTANVFLDRFLKG